MKLISISLSFFGLLLLPMVCISTAEAAGPIDFHTADSLLLARSHDLRLARRDVDAAEGQLAQSRLYDNPTMSVMYNVRNPVNRRWFDPGREGELDVQVSQPFAIGGQHSEQVRQSAAQLSASRSQLQLTRRDLLAQAHTALIDLYYRQQQAAVYDLEIASVQRILAAYSEQSAKGNVAGMEAARIKTMLCQLSKQRADLLVGVSGLQAQLRSLLGIEGTEPVTAVIDERKALDEAAKLCTALTSDGSAAPVDTLPEIQALSAQAEAARHGLKWQRSQALPQMAVQGEYDKNGNIGHNFYAVGLSLSLPLWNRNRGNIRSGKAAVEQAAIEMERRRLELAQQRAQDLAIVRQYLPRPADASAVTDDDLGRMLQAAEKQYMNRHITLLEFVDLYSNYRDTRLALLDARSQALQAAERLRMIWGGETAQH